MQLKVKKVKDIFTIHDLSHIYLGYKYIPILIYKISIIFICFLIRRNQRYRCSKHFEVNIFNILLILILLFRFDELPFIGSTQS